MLCNAKALNGYSLDSLDGQIGKAEEFYFDDRYWTVRYLVANSGGWLLGRKVLLSPHALSAINKEARQIEVSLTKQQIEDSPPLNSDKPVSRQWEESYYTYFWWPVYWGGPNAWGSYPYLTLGPGSLSPDGTVAAESVLEDDRERWDPNLRSTRDVTGYHVQAQDGEIGHIDDFVIDDSNWMIRYIIVDTKNWWPGKKVLLSPQWVDSVSWEDQKVFINLPRSAVEHSPEFTDDVLITRTYESALHGHYNRKGYWVEDSAKGELPT